jgi:beta-glucosidase
VNHTRKTCSYRHWCKHSSLSDIFDTTKLMLSLLVVVCALSAAVAAKYSPARSSYVDTLLASMTLQEKIGQMVQIDIAKFMKPGTDVVDYDLVKQWVNDYKIGSILNSPFSGGQINGVSGWTAAQYRDMIINLQKITEETQSKAPIIYGIDSIHGATFVKDAALFPQALAVAATFDTDMAFKSAKVSSRDTRAAGIQWLFAPVLGLGLHPNWARFPETFGEDPYLAAAMGKATIDGIQYYETVTAPSNGDTTQGIPARAAACMKHFIAYSYPVNGHDRSPVLLPDRMVKQLYLPSFQAAVDTGVMTGMESYQEVGGEPMVSSRTYLTDLLRKEMGFEGMLVTDYAEIENLFNWHRVVASQKDAVQLSMTDTTVDMSMVPLDSSFGDYLQELVSEGKLDASRVEESARRVLQLKEDLGMFEPRNRRFAAQDTLLEQVGSAEDWQLSLDASRAALTLLKNQPHTSGAAPVLPITNSAANIFVTGPTADSLPSQTGGWSIHWQGPLGNDEVPQGVTILQG